MLAGGQGRRLGGDKALVELCGRPLISYPLAALRAVLDEVVVVAKRHTRLPELDVPVWIEPDEPCHPLAGIVHALRQARGRAVLVCAMDLPLITPALVRSIATADARGAPAVVLSAGEALQPLLARYEPLALERLAVAAANAPLREIVRALEPRLVEVEPDHALMNVNTPEDLALATTLLT